MPFRSRSLTDPASPSRRAALGRLAGLPLALAACGRDFPEPVLAAGKPMPDLSLPDLQGRMVRLGQPGRPAVLNFWATWCPPCRAEMGGLERIYRKFADAGLVVLGISVDSDPNLIREFVLQQGLSFPMVWDKDGVASRGALGIRVFPTTVLVRRDGIIADLVVGERNWDEAPAREWVRALL